MVMTMSLWWPDCAIHSSTYAAVVGIALLSLEPVHFCEDHEVKAGTSRGHISLRALCIPQNIGPLISHLHGRSSVDLRPS